MIARELVEPEFLNDLDDNFKLFCKEVRKDLRLKKDCVIAITGYPGYGKSTLAVIFAMLTDKNFDIEKNVCFIPTSKQIKETYLSIPMYSVLHIDEASRGLHKHKWHDKVQQTLNQLYDTEREDHFLCTLLLMPRFQNFTENFRNFRIKYWVNVIERGIALVYKRDEDKDTKDPWHMDENYRKKLKRWRGKRIFERELNETIRVEQITDCYWFYFKFPDLPDKIKEEYLKGKRDSRVVEEVDFERESYKDKVNRERLEKWSEAKALLEQGFTQRQISIKMGVSDRTISNYLKNMDEYEAMKSGVTLEQKKSNNLYTTNKINNFPKIEGG